MASSGRGTTDGLGVKQRQPFYGQWRKRAVGGLLLIAFAPLLLVVVIRAADAAAQAVIELLGPVIPYVIVILALAGIYRLVLGRRQL
jgi:hypothetical protein